jgi:hypothetical protein
MHLLPDSAPRIASHETLRSVQCTENINLLGMNLDCSLTWKSHIDTSNFIKKMSLICFMLRKFLPTVNAKVLLMVYFACWYLQICYGVIFRGLSSSMRYMFIIERRAIRMMNLWMNICVYVCICVCMYVCMFMCVCVCVCVCVYVCMYWIWYWKVKCII